MQRNKRTNSVGRSSVMVDKGFWVWKEFDMIILKLKKICFMFFVGVLSALVELTFA